MARIGTQDDDARNGNRAPLDDTAAAASTRTERKQRASSTGTGGGRQSSMSGATPPPPRQRVRVAEGIYKDCYGFAATVKVNGVQREIRFPPGTPMKTIRARRDELRASLRLNRRRGSGTLADDAVRYLDQIRTTLTSFADRRRHLEAWLPRFGHLDTLGLTDRLYLLNHQLRDWRHDLSASSCNQRRDALTNLVKVLHGRRAVADFVDLVRFTREPSAPRWLDRSHISAVLAHLTPGSKTKVRLRLMHWTGMRPSQMGRLRRDDFRFDDAIPFVAVPRGKGGRLAAIPLIEEGLQAARDFVSRDAFGPWSCPSANKALARAARIAQRPAFTVYAIRHSFAAGLRRTGADVADIQDLYGHTNPSTTMIYAPPQLVKHQAAIARLRALESDATRKRLAVPAGSTERVAVSR